MNILMLTSSLDSGGAETHIFELVCALTERSHTLCVASSGGEIAQKLEEKGIRHIKLPLDSKSPRNIIRSAKTLRKLLAKEHFDTVHVHSRIAAFVCHLALRGKVRPLIVSTVHARFRTGLLLRKLSYWGCASIAVSEDLREYLSEQYGISREKIHVIPNAIDTEKFSPPRDNASEGTPPKILFVSRLDADCSLGAALLCRIAPELSARFKGIKIELVGGGKEYKKLCSVAEKVNRSLGYECVSLCGYSKNVADKLRSADVFVGVSRAALEAMSCAVPVVLCGNEGFLGLVDASNLHAAAKTNFCCRGSELPTAPALLAAASTLLEMKSSARYALGEYLRDYVCHHHGKENLAKLTESFYLSALSNEGRQKGGTVLCGYYGFENLGDDALLSAAIERIRRENQEESISVICHAPKKIKKEFGLRAIRRESPVACAKEIKGAKRLVFGGGSVLQNASSMRSLVYYTELMRFAARHGVEVELMANGLGPLKSKRAQKRAAKALKICSRLGFRDEDSAALAKKLGCDGSKIVVEDDLSASLGACTEKEISQLLRSHKIDKHPYFLVALHGKSDRKTKKRIFSEITQLKRSRLTPVFVIMHAKEDKKISRRFAKKHGGVCLDGLKPSELVAICARAEFAIGNRYHLLYLAKRAEVPIIAYGDDPKLLSLRD